MSDKFKCLDDAIAASRSAAAAALAINRVLERFRDRKMTIREMRDASDEATAMMLAAAEQMRLAMHEFRAGYRRATGGGL